MNLIRAAGLSAVVAGIIFAAIQPVKPLDVLASVNTSSFILITSLKTMMSIFGLFGITGLYARQVEKAGWLGLTGYILVTIFFAVQMCISFIEPTILPLLTSEVPAFVESALAMRSGGAGPMNLGALATVYSLVSVLYLFGLLLFGIALFRARILLRGAAVMLAISGHLAGILFTLLPQQLDRLTGIPMGIALVWLGFALFFERRAPRKPFHLFLTVIRIMQVKGERRVLDTSSGDLRGLIATPVAVFEIILWLSVKDFNRSAIASKPVKAETTEALGAV